MVPAWRLYLTALEARFSQDLLEPLAVGLDRQAGVGRGQDLDGELALGGQGADQVDGVLDDLEQVDRLRRQCQVAGLDPGDVEYLVDQLEQVAAAPQHVVDALGLLGGEVVELEQLAEPEDGVEGVRSSWLILDRNSLLARLARSASSLACSMACSARRRPVTSATTPTLRTGWPLSSV